ncbi:MAG: Na+/H+ antiporter subunit E [Pseudomonadota bacterium]
MRSLTLLVALAAFWLALSGHYKPLLLGIGAVVVVLAVALAHRMRIADEEGVPVEFVPGTLLYMPWLLVEILKSSWNVALIIINPRLPISPTMTVVRASQSSPVGVNVYANSITLTPGTVTTGVDDTSLTIHALARDGADDIETGRMDAHVTSIFG